MIVDDAALRQGPLDFHPLFMCDGGVGRVVVGVEGLPGLTDDVVVLEDVVLDLGGQLV